MKLVSIIICSTKHYNKLWQNNNYVFLTVNQFCFKLCSVICQVISHILHIIIAGVGTTVYVVVAAILLLLLWLLLLLLLL